MNVAAIVAAMTAPRILLAIATLALAGCDSSVPPVDHERRVGSPVSVVSTPTSVDEGADDAVDCTDECGEPSCECLEDESRPEQ